MDVDRIGAMRQHQTGWADMTKMRNTLMSLLTMLVTPVSLLGCAAASNPQAANEPRSWDGKLQVYCALHAMFHEGQMGAMVSLESLLPNPDLHALGALADLSGEVTVIGGRAYLAYPEEADAMRNETTLRTDATATLLAASEAPAWHSAVITK